MTVYIGRIANQRKVPKWLQVRITKYLLYMYGGHMCICILNMEFLRLNLWLGEVCTDNANDDVNDTIHDANDTNDDDAQRTKHDRTRLFG